ncbi:C-type lectin BpLec-like isoform X1 [Gopherus flavomarginatus]|uniref:C-type lectin BpLec-like isoform X1 n=1 Tax=Gopherus flavomarginatus TaxID=286002 RepID=UPI0021CBF3BD|nr:C-type lectin BpLec-like isoform X1 [Gopherus flavomarginatus]
MRTQRPCPAGIPAQSWIPGASFCQSRVWANPVSSCSARAWRVLPARHSPYHKQITPSLSAEAPAMSCPRGWLSFHDTCYRYFHKKKNWMEAEAHCQHQRHGAHLTSIHSRGENKMLAHYIKRYHKKCSLVWIGLSDPHGDQGWRWSDNSMLSFTAWDNGQPDNPRKNEHCVVLEHPGFQKWHDYPCDWRFSFVCKHKP